MSQQFNTYVVSPGDAAAEGDLNRFLRGHRVLKVDREFCDGSWHFCVAWETGEGPLKRSDGGKPLPKIDYKEVLDAPTFALFSKLREVRKTMADRDRLPAFAILTNEQLAEVAKRRCRTLDDLRAVEGIGDGRIGKYGETLLETIGNHEKQQSEIGTDRGPGEPA